MFKVNNKDTRTTSNDVVLTSSVFIAKFERFSPFASVFIVEFEQVNGR